MLRAGDCEIALAFHYPRVQVQGAGPEAVGAGVPLGPPGRPGSEESWGRDDLVLRPLLTDRLIGLLPEGHRLAAADRVGIEELAGEPWIAGCARCRRHLVEVCERVGFTPRIEFATDDSPAVIGLVAAGLGVAVLPELALAAVGHKGAALVEIEPVVRREVVALTLPDLARVPAVEATLEQLALAAGR
jgi:DNA-binding transcriptional LysR family regulator